MAEANTQENDTSVANFLAAPKINGGFGFEREVQCLPLVDFIGKGGQGQSRRISGGPRAQTAPVHQKEEEDSRGFSYRSGLLLGSD